ncbi:hypothetical protein KC19_12G032300 [Ceratodon purpureus]|uniref:Protein kinase domain-containing protein n=1 Tax=Ceratodon purpureus TaxID=3225 RepID=A0A8T0G6K7_CERPU|nr:hypothetical protein KC19_12G032300 [Ceratodon purpureus]
MAVHCDPSKLLVLKADLIEHFQLPQCYVNSPSRAEMSPDGRFIVSITITDFDEFNKSRFMRLPIESFPDLRESQLEVLKNLCYAAHPSEEFFVTDATNQWLRTAIKSDSASVNLLSLTLTNNEREGCTVIHSNVLPYDPYWTSERSSPVEDGSRRVHLIPCCIFGEGDLEEGNTLTRKLQQWAQENLRPREECDLVKHVQQRSMDGNIEPRRPASKKVWEIRAESDVNTIRSFGQGSDGTIWLVTWRRGKFVRKDHNTPEGFEIELKVMGRLCHPHIVYIFGISRDGSQSSLFMECMERDLESVIFDLDARPEGGDEGPPFMRHNSIDILLQVAKAMVHMHEKSVIHGDLKSSNILISKFLTSENRSHYLAKVADFGSAQVLDSTDFKAANGTTLYSAPEVLKFRTDKNVVFACPEKIDVYSFGIVAFEVLTGMKPYPNMTMSQVATGAREGTLDWREVLPLRENCRQFNTSCDERLISLVERCWGPPELRPSFLDIVDVLVSISGQIPEPSSTNDDSQRQANLANGYSGASEEPVFGHNGHNLSPPVRANNTVLQGQVRNPARRRNRLKNLLGHFLCASSGKVQH